MRRTDDKISRAILKILLEAKSPLETKEIELVLKNVTRTKLLYRLNLLRGDQLIRGKAIGSGKGTWIWWRNKVFENNG
ncbi:MAG: hypothetical protein Q8Q01_04820 [archaeon]|nr:hypothetical protein [archaeon]